MRRFAGIDRKYCGYESAAVLLQSIPYDGTSTWGKGADRGFAAFLDALENMELYDIETDSEAYRHGVHILADITEDESPEKVFELVYQKTRELLASNKYLTFFGGEHSISIGVIRAFYEKYADLTVLQLDAHADLRESYGGTAYNHACALHDASHNTNLVQVGIRSADASEMKYLNQQQCYFAEDIYGHESWMDRSIAQMTDQVYLTIDLDAFDPSIMPATGTPEPGGLLWNPTLKYLRKVFEAKTVVGFDITEFAPLEGQHAPQFLVAKLYYKLLSYKFKYNG
ncbi:MAG: agmatinase [Xanthomonadales bacterium]|nr:agmatinase [Xanthomonadales bacterium]